MSTLASPTTLRPPWVHLARAAWIVLAGILLVLYALVTSRRLAEPLPSCAAPEAACPGGSLSREDVQLAGALGLPVPLLATASLVSSLAGQSALALTGLFIFWRRSDDWVALLWSAALISIVLEGGLTTGVALLDRAAGALYLAGALIFAPVPFLFPDGRFQPRWTRWFILGMSGWIVVAGTISPEAALAGPPWLAWLALSVYAMAYRYSRVSTPAQRQQTKWVLAGMLCAFAVSVVWITVTNLYPASQPSPARLALLLALLVLYPAGYVAFAAGIAISILRYRLWEIDRLINRALVYGALTASLALVYFGSVVVLRGMFAALTGQAGQTPLAVVASTLAIAALFAPLRRRLQDLIDRRFYRRKYDAAQALAAFGAVARDETDLDQLAGKLVGVVRETMQPSAAALWLRAPEAGGRRAERE